MKDYRRRRRYTVVVVTLCSLIAVGLAVAYGPYFVKYRVFRYASWIPVEWYADDLNAPNPELRKRAANALMMRAYERDTSQYLASALRDPDAGVRRAAVVGLTTSRKHGPLSAMDDSDLASALLKMMNTAPTEQERLDGANYASEVARLTCDAKLQDRIRREVRQFITKREARAGSD